ncbi:hypothetical protein J6590_072725 [Homalodisca vitripennis]|nr:hypothetical protein J6590_072725 [Homalodisca vitripennis]
MTLISIKGMVTPNFGYMETNHKNNIMGAMITRMHSRRLNTHVRDEGGKKCSHSFLEKSIPALFGFPAPRSSTGSPTLECPLAEQNVADNDRNVVFITISVIGSAELQGTLS